MTAQAPSAHITARSAGFLHDIWSIALRAIRQLPRTWRPPCRRWPSRCSSS